MAALLPHSGLRDTQPRQARRGADGLLLGTPPPAAASAAAPSPRGPRRQGPCIAAQATAYAAGAPSVGLASYPFPALQPSVPQWLAESLRDVATHIDQAPMLQLVLPGRGEEPLLQRHTVPPAIVHTPQLWRAIAEHLSRSDPDSMVMVHPLADTEEASSGSVRAVKARLEGLGVSEGALSGIAVREQQQRHLAQHHWRLDACSKLLAAGLATPELAGRVGDCCEGGGPGEAAAAAAAAAPGTAPREELRPKEGGLASNITSFTRPRPGAGASAGKGAAAAAQQAQRSAAAAAGAASDAAAAGTVGYYGVVVQSKHRDGAEGCYILKTVRVASSHDECTCLHYTLVRVCRGEPIASQLMASWLA